MERSLVAQEHIKTIWFFPVRDIPLRFICYNLVLSALIGRIELFFVQTLQRVHDQSYLKLSVAGEPAVKY